MSNRRDVARQVNEKLRGQKRVIDDTIPKMLNEGMILAAGDSAKGREMAATIGSAVDILPVRDWEAGMTTYPGELVYNPDKTYIYAYSGASPMTHSNHTYYPGASGVYYWLIVPKMKDGVKIYPNISGIVVSVKKNEIWWNQIETAKYSWNGADNANCSWPPTAGNEWTKVE